VNVLFVAVHESGVERLRHFAAMQWFVRCWSNSRHRTALGLDGSVENDPLLTLQTAK
jgi:hypothetical protein